MEKDFKSVEMRKYMDYDYRMISKDLLLWYEKEKRELPWRSRPLPYYVWISEIMLQQTRVEAVKEYFNRFIEAFPTVEDLAQGQEDKLMKLWEGLGYYQRARNLWKAAKVVTEEYNGKFPDDYEEIKKLPGIGPYTAGAIASIAFGICVPAVDGNVLRVTKRLSGSYDDISKEKVKRQLEGTLRQVMEEEKLSGDFNQALMELGAVVCIPNGKPLCEKCPVAVYCIAKQKNIMMELPMKPAKKKRKIEDKTVLVMEYESRYGIHQRGDKGLLARLWEYPNLEGRLSIDRVESLLMDQGIKEYEMGLLGEAKHIFSHVEWHMLGYKIKIKEWEKKLDPDSIKNTLVWADEKALETIYALPSAFSAYHP